MAGMEEHTNLVNQGTVLMLNRVLKDLQADDEAMQTRALQALQSLAKGKRGGSNLPFQSIQSEFQRGKGLPRLVHLLDRVVTPRSRSGQGKAIMAGAIDALAAMTRNNAAARKEAIEAGAVPALCSVLGTGDDEPVSIEVLKALYTIIAPDASGHTTTELFASGGVHALVRLLDNVLEYAREPQRSVWVREVLALLYPLVRRSRMVARLLASEMVGVCNVLQTVGDPLSLSLALDIMEEVLHAGDARKYGRRMARDGALAALVHAAHEKGMGSKAMLLLAGLAREAELLHVLRSMLQPRDYACLVAISRRAADAEDLDGRPCLELLSQLLSGPGVGGLRALALGRCLNTALSLQPIASDLFMQATGDAGLLVLENLPCEAVAEAAVAAALLLEHVPQAVSVLLRPGALNSLVDAALEEVASPGSDATLGSEACNALSSAVRWLPHDIPLSRQNTGTEEHLRQPSRRQNGPVPDDDESPSESQPQPSNEKGSMERSQTGQLDSIAEQEAPHSNGDLPVQERALENGHSDAAQDSEQYETLTFHVGGKEFYALAWVMAGASRAIAQTLQQIPDTSTAAVVIPDVPGLPLSRMYEVFALAAECAMERSRLVPVEDAMDLWALAASLQMPEIQRRCERVIATSALQSDGCLERALSLTRGHKDSGASLREVCAKHVLEHLAELRQSGHLASLVKQHHGELRRGMVVFLRRQLQAAKPDSLRNSQVPSSTCGDSPRSARSVASSRPGVLGLSRFASLADAMDRQGSVPAASVASRDSPTPSRAASCGQFEVMGKGSLTNDD